MKYNKELAKYFEEKGFYVVKPSDKRAVVDLMTECFYDYPLLQFFLGKTDKKATRLFMEVSMNALAENCVIVADSEKINSLMCFYPPEMGEPSAVGIITHGGLSFFPAFGIGKVIRMIKYLSGMDKVMSKYKKKTDGFIYYLATAPSMRGKGLAKKLTQAAVEFCKEKKSGIYLETNKQTNSVIYQKWGFELKETVDVPDSDGMKTYALYTP